MLNDPVDMLPDLEDPKACLQRAVKCEQMAKSKIAGKDQAILLELAGRWREMAREIETRFGTR